MKEFEVITLCGSTRFKKEFDEENERLTLEGNVVLSIGIAKESTGIKNGTPEKEMLMAIHRQKVRMADRIHVINYDGYVGEHTKEEIKYAFELGKDITFMEPIREAITGFHRDF